MAKKKLAKRKKIVPDMTKMAVRGDLIHHYLAQNKDNLSAFRSFGKSRTPKGRSK